MAELRPFVASGRFPAGAGERPSLYVCRRAEEGRAWIGLVALASVEAYEQRLILPHERTQVDRERDRARHLEAVGGHDEPVLLTYRAMPQIDRRLAQITQGPPDLQVAEEAGETAFWRVGPDEGVFLEEAFRQVPRLYIADGHHRLAASSHLRGRGRRTGGPEDWFLAILAPHDQLRILPFHRAVRDLNGLTPQGLLGRLSEDFEVLPAPRAPEPGPNRFSMLLEGRWWQIALRPGRQEASVLGRLDVVILQSRVLAPLLGVMDPRVDPRIEFIGRPTAREELEQRVGSGEFAVGFVLHPTDMEQVLAVSDAGEIMPPQSTCFEPKPRKDLLTYQFERERPGWRKGA